MKNLLEAIMKDKIVLITGANSGIGKETTRALAKKGATIIMACRHLEKAEPVGEIIQRESKNPNIEVMKLDLASLKSVRNFTQEFKTRYQKLNVLINNAGVFCMKREETEEGFEKTMGVNHLGHFLLTYELLPILENTPEARIINLSSNAHFSGDLDLGDLHFKRRKYSGFKAYGASRLATVFFTQELAERLKEKDITVNSLHPGHVDTNMWDLWGTERKWYQSIINGIIKLFLISAEEGAQTSIYLASSNEVKGITGKYFAKKKIKAASKKCSDIKLQKELWQLSEQLTGINK
jgi:NAD(P)-dependent dehydrogenase (short-subunit alcohol dehydrogenase family)